MSRVRNRPLLCFKSYHKFLLALRTALNVLKAQATTSLILPHSLQQVFLEQQVITKKSTPQSLKAELGKSDLCVKRQVNYNTVDKYIAKHKGKYICFIPGNLT